MSFVAHEDHAPHDFFSNHTNNNEGNNNNNSNNSNSHTDFHSILSSRNSHTRLLDENHDILDEFLDQRVYDSMGTTTPNNNTNINNDNGDRNSNNPKIKQEQFPGETLMNSLYALTDNTNDIPVESNTFEHGINGSNFPQFSDLPNGSNHNNGLDMNVDGISPQDNDYLYMELPHDSNFSHDPLSSKHEAQTHQNSITNSIFHTPNAMTSPEETKSISNGHAVVQSNPTSLSEYEFVREELNKLKFGCHRINAAPKTVDIPDPSYLDFSSEAMSKLPHKMALSALPSHSRVETQIRCDITLNPAPNQALLYVPQDLISKNKFCLSDPLETLHPRLRENLLFLDAYVLTSDLQQSCNICSRCIKREQKRASRGKAAGEMDEGQFSATTPAAAAAANTTSPSSSKTPAAIKNNSTSWADEKMMKKAIIFNCKEIVSFPSPSGLKNNNSKSIELSARIICYCRHHKESTGFRVLILIKNNKGEVVAKQLSSPIMIMDRKKNIPLTKDSLPNSVVGSSVNLQALDDTGSKKKRISNSDSENEHKFSNNEFGHHSSPNSVDESASEVQTNTDAESSRGLKRKKLSVDDSYNASANPMYNGSISGYSPLSNSDTNTSTNIHFMKQPSYAGLSPMGTQHPPPNPQLQQMQTPQSSSSSSQQQTLQRLPSIQRIIPAQGPIRGGIEITLLGFNFRPGLSVKFGPNQALATHCWSETTIVTYLPPASQPGQVLVSFENEESSIIGGPQQQQIFTYTDDTDRQLIELALQIVGLKMNGKLEDAKNIAKRIVGSDASTGGNSNGTAPNSMTASPTNLAQSQEDVHDWFNSAHASLKKLTSSGLSTQVILIRLLSLVDLPNCPIIIPNWQLANTQGQTLLHLATMKNYHKLIKFLVTHGCKIDVKDNQGLTPLFLASMCGHRKLIQLFIECKSNWNLKLSNDKYLRDYCDLNVIDMFKEYEEQSLQQQQQHQLSSDIGEDDANVIKKTTSFDSLDSMFDDDYGRHISKMSQDDEVHRRDLQSQDQHDSAISAWEGNRNYSSEFADSEFESEDDYDEEEADYCDDEYSDGDDVEVSDGEEDHSQGAECTRDADHTSDAQEPSKPPSSPGLWQKVKNVFNKEEDSDLPQYDDLFPFGPSSSLTAKPKSALEQSMNDATQAQSAENTSSTNSKADLEPTSSKLADTDTDPGLASDSSEDMVVTYINHPRKPVEHDRMLVFFWIPALVVIFALFFMVYVVGYNFKQLDYAKEFVRNTVGNPMVGNERITKVFKSTSGGKVAAAGNTATTAIRRVVDF
ncbi:SPT23 [Candida margitis]|uniref:SPT23 n=1 Tax=Candida margitis TaxID=1775924 RepID=UPI002227CA1F|nr:SPT23 [Candida margitis]KAI5950596.1 SPT23 [Candida margitis]